MGKGGGMGVRGSGRENVGWDVGEGLGQRRGVEDGKGGGEEGEGGGDVEKNSCGEYGSGGGGVVEEGME